MSELKIYGSQGQLFYPEGGQSERRERGFGWLVLEYNPRDERPHIEAYSQMIINGESKQVFVRYYYDNELHKFNEFRDVFRNKIIKDKGWKISEPGDYDRARPFWELVVKNNASAKESAEEILRKHPRIDKNYHEVKQWLEDSNDSKPPLKLIAPQRYIGSLVKVLSELNVSILVNNGDSFIESGDIEIRSSRGAGRIKVADKSEEYIKSLVKEQKESRREEQYQKLTAALENLNSLNTPQQKVSSKLGASLNDTFPGLEVSEKQSPSQRQMESGGPSHSDRRSKPAEIGNARTPHNPDRGTKRVDQTDTERGGDMSTEQRGGKRPHLGPTEPIWSRIFNIISFRALLFIIIFFAIAALALFVVFSSYPGLLPGELGSADFTAEISGGNSIIVNVNGTQGEQYNVSVYGGPSNNKQISTDIINQSGNFELDVDTGEYKVVVHSVGNPGQRKEKQVVVESPSPTSSVAEFNQIVFGNQLYKSKLKAERGQSTK